MLDLNTFGKTPAAHYLVRRLNEIGSKSLNRACTVRANAFNQTLAELDRLASLANLDAKVHANLLRLLRKDATEIELDPGFTDSSFVSQLLRNVIIGKIKQQMRSTSTIRKIERNSVDLHTAQTRSSSVTIDGPYALYDIAGVEDAVYNLMGTDDVFMTVCASDLKDPTTPEILHERSLRRCIRQGKPHTQLS